MGKKILLADDSITIQKVIELTFSDEDFEVVTVGNGRLAVERVQEVLPDLVLCDIIMPEKDGYEVCDFIKKTPALSHIPVLLLTGAFEPFDQERAARVGCDGFLAKPFEPQTLIAKVKELLNQGSARVSRGAPAAAPAPSAPAPPAASAPPVPAAAAAPPAPPVPSYAVTQPTPAYAPPPAAPPTWSPAPPPPAWTPAPPVYTAPPPVPPPAPPAATAAPPPPAAAEPEVTFIPDEPFAEEVPEYVETPRDYEGTAATVFDEPPLPPPYEPERVEEVPYEMDDAGTDDLMEVSAEESASLAEPITETTLVDHPTPWSQPTIEVPLEMRAQASLESAQAAASDAIFEEVFEEERVIAPAPASTDTGITEAFEPVVPEELEPPSAPPPPPAPAAAAPEPPIALAAPAAVPVQPPPPPPAAAAPAPEPEPPSPPREETSFEDVTPAAPETAAPAPSAAAEVAVPMDMVEKIAQRVVAQISEKVIREIAWEVIPDLAESLIKKEIDRLKAELQQT
jgi:CheY-like chemotaxis protein